MGRLIAKLGFWIENTVNLMLTMAIFLLPPLLVWRWGLHWGFIVLAAFFSMIAAAFISERVLMRHSRVERLFPGMGKYSARPGDVQPGEFKPGITYKDSIPRPHVPEEGETDPEPGILSRLKGHGWRVGVTVFGLVLFGGGVLCIIFLKQSLTHLRWPSTDGIVIQSGIRFETGEYDPGYYAPDMSYEYVVEGRKYTGTFISIGKLEMFFTEKGALKRVGDYPEGRMVTVYYDPRDPSWAVLEKGLGLFTMLLPVAGIFLLWFGASAIKGALTEKNPSAEGTD